MSSPYQYVRFLENLSSKDVSLVGGKNASLGEMIRSLKQENIEVPDGFATTSDAYRLFLEKNNLDESIRQKLSGLEQGGEKLSSVGQSIRR
ncbi:MAG: PEP/pyruvate-binding domain-containing protein, partial [Desulfovibrionales bacterium]